MNIGNQEWPQITAVSRPWTRWWWLGSAVTKERITELLAEYQREGIGGVEITSIYGADGQDECNIGYLSADWIEMIKHTISEAQSLGMEVDIPPGSGWRIGGGFVGEEISAMRFEVAAADNGEKYRLEIEPSGELVKRAGPGGTGKSFNPFFRESFRAVEEHFISAFEQLDVRAQFHDSWEYESNACADLEAQFLKRRGYELSAHLADIAGNTTDDLKGRILYDISITLSELAQESFLQPWNTWCHSLGHLSRNQGHGSPGNLLDFYAASDIPETEVFKEYAPDTPLISKLASSAAHVTRKRITSSETATWLKEHFHVALSDIKMLADNLFVSGINHHVYHGTAYSPAGTNWPGWLFYASTQLNPQNPIWRDFGKLNGYIARVQSVLQSGEPENDILVYLPIHDVLQDSSREPGDRLSIEGEWLKKLIGYDFLRQLWHQGYAFDYISDAQLSSAVVSNGGLQTGGAWYKAIIVPPCRFIVNDTLQLLLQLKERGAPVIFASPLPHDVPGLFNLEDRRLQFRELMACVDGEDVRGTLKALGIDKELCSGHRDVHSIRRRHSWGYYYFVVNQGTDDVDTWVSPSTPYADAHLLDPMTGAFGGAQIRDHGKQEIRLKLASGESAIIRTLTEKGTAIQPRRYESTEESYVLSGPWHIHFVEGGPELPVDCTMARLSSWTEIGDAAEWFSGTALYSIEFDIIDSASRWMIDLGEVHESARIRLNGTEIDTLIGPSYRVVLPNVREGSNNLEVEVTNLAANRIRYMDLNGTAWKIFGDINIVGRDYKPLDASLWQVAASGLIGPVQLHKLK